MILPRPVPKASGMKTRLVCSLLLVLAGAALFASLRLPIWRVTLDAPQYPEGMGMQIWAHTIKGENPHDLVIINQLNHYIGMQAIVPESIPELKIIAPIILGFGILCLLAAIKPKVWAVAILLAGLAGAGALGMYDFWRWEYDYGHNLDPRAAIRIPGQSYQPPLIGTAKLLNFTSTSWPASGGYLLFGAGGMIFLALSLLVLEKKRADRFRGFVDGAGRFATRLPAWPLLAAAGILASGCGRSGPSPIDWGSDACHHCRMALVQKGFAAQRINDKGKVYKFDAVECLLADLEAKSPGEGERFYVSDWSRPEAEPSPAQEATFLKGGRIPSPMGGNLAGFAHADSARLFQERLDGEVFTWEALVSE